jgi:hypothetical protein
VQQLEIKLVCGDAQLPCGVVVVVVVVVEVVVVVVVVVVN